MVKIELLMLIMKNWTVHVPGPCELLCLFLAVQTQHATDNDVAKLFAYFCQCNVFLFFFSPVLKELFFQENGWFLC